MNFKYLGQFRTTVTHFNMFILFLGEMLTGLSFLPRMWAISLVSAWATHPKMERK